MTFELSFPGPSGSGSNANTMMLNRRSECATSPNRRRYSEYFMGESSAENNDDTESIHSYQDYETEIARDTPDTDTKSEQEESSGVEYEPVSASDDSNNLSVIGNNSSSATEDWLMAASAVTAVLCDSSPERWLTDGEESDNSSVDTSGLARADFGACIQCKSLNNNRLFRYCQKCFQMRKNLFPPRPRGHRKRRRKTDKPSPYGTTLSQHSVPCSSQDSGLGLSQEFPTVQIIDAASTSQPLIIVNTRQGVKRKSAADEESDLPSDEVSNSKRVRSVDNNDTATTSNACGVKRKSAADEESALSRDIKRVRSERDCNVRVGSDVVIPEADNTATTNEERPTNITSKELLRSCLPEYRERCIMCNVESKNGLFLHSNSIGHICCCYKCAKITWRVNKKCPVCNAKIKNVVKVFTL